MRQLSGFISDILEKEWETPEINWEGGTWLPKLANELKKRWRDILKTEKKTDPRFCSPKNRHSILVVTLEKFGRVGKNDLLTFASTNALAIVNAKMSVYLNKF